MMDLTVRGSKCMGQPLIPLINQSTSGQEGLHASIAS